MKKHKFYREDGRAGRCQRNDIYEGLCNLPETDPVHQGRKAPMPKQGREPSVVAEDIARRFHATYERLAPELGYTTREASVVPWPEVPEKNRKLMIATVQRLLDRGVIAEPLPAHLLPTVEVDARRWKEAEQEWSNGVLLDCPESWDGDDAAEHIALSYVATLEARCDAAGISREKWMGEQ